MQATDRSDRPPKHTMLPHDIIVETERSTHPGCSWQAVTRFLGRSGC